MSVGCGLLKPKETPDPTQAIVARKTPLSPEETQELLGEVGDNFVYGQGVGEAALNVGAIAAFPPFAAVVIGNAALSLSGYEPIGVSTALPEEEESWWESAYDGVTSAPGRLVAAIAGEEYRSKEVAKQRLTPFLSAGGATEDSGTAGGIEMDERVGDDRRQSPPAQMLQASDSGDSRASREY